MMTRWIRLHLSTSVAGGTLALLLIGLSGCSPGASGDSQGSQRVAVLPTAGSPLQADPLEDPRAGRLALLDSSHLGQVFRLVLETHVDGVEAGPLVAAAERSLSRVLNETSSLPLELDLINLAPLPNEDRETGWRAFARTYQTVVQRYADWAMARRPDHAVLRDMLASLNDNHTNFISPDEHRRRNESGYSGIGVRLGKTEPGQLPRIVEVFPGSPAAEAGLRPADRILSVDGRPLQGLPLNQVVETVRGLRGTSLTLQVQRPGASTPLAFTLTRAEVEVSMVEGATFGQLGYLRIRTFNETTPALSRGVLTEGKARGAVAWLADLRGNGGGGLDAVQRVAGLFLAGKEIGLEVDRARNEVRLTAIGQPVAADVPVLVLVDDETSSGAEILSAALRQHAGASLVGETTAGNVAVAQEHTLPDGSGVQITARRFLTPSGEAFPKTGLRPDVRVPMTDADLAQGRDPQLARGLELLHQVAQRSSRAG